MTISDTIRVAGVPKKAVQGTASAAPVSQTAKSLPGKSVQTVWKPTVRRKALPADSVYSADSSEVYVIPQAIRPAVPEGPRVKGQDFVTTSADLVCPVPECEPEEIDSVLRARETGLLTLQDGRAAGEQTEFRMAGDDYICSLLLVSFFISAWIVTRSRRYLTQGLKDFFNGYQRENMFDDSSDSRMPGRMFFSFVVSLSLGILMFSYQQHFQGDIFRLWSPYWVLAADVCCCWLAYGVRTACYVFVNSVFFERDRNEKWLESYRLLTVVSGVLLLPVVLFIVFNNLDFANWQILLFAIVAIIEIFLIFKTYRIFFEGTLGFLHIILYLCTLEFLPVLSVWKCMVWVTQELTKLV